jgi:hypothetical protein
MNTNRNSMKIEAELAEAAFPLAYATVFKEGWERVVRVSKTSLEAVEENAEVLASYQGALKGHNPFLFDLAGRALKGYVTFQKSLLDLAVEQSAAGVGVQATTAPSHDVGKAKAAIIQPSLDSTDAAQATVLNHVAKQSKARCDTEKQPVGVATAPVQMDTDADSVQLRMLAKEIVDLTIIPLAKPTVQ